MSIKRKSIFLLVITFLIIQMDGIALLPGVNLYVGVGISLVLWLIGSILIYLYLRKSNKECSFYENNKLTSNDYTIIFFALMCGLAMAGTNYIDAGIRPLIIREYFSGHIIYTIRNIIYYPVEILLMLEILILGQKVGELVIKKKNIPYGVFVLFILWGLPHIIYHGLGDGIITALRVFIYSIPFYVSKRNFKTSYLSMLILWLL